MTWTNVAMIAPANVAVAVLLEAGLLVWLLSAVPLPVALCVAVVCGWVVFDLVQP